MKPATKKIVLTKKGLANRQVQNAIKHCIFHEKERNGANGEFVKVSKVAFDFINELKK